MEITCRSKTVMENPPLPKGGFLVHCKRFKLNGKHMGKVKELVSSVRFKTTIASVAGAVNAYLVGRGYIAADTATLVSSILVALGFMANVTTYSSTSKKP